MKEIRTVIIGFGGMGKKYAKIIAEGQAPGLTLQGFAVGTSLVSRRSAPFILKRLCIRMWKIHFLIRRILTQW